MMDEFVSDLQQSKKQASLFQNWDSAAQGLISVLAKLHTKSLQCLWNTSHFTFPTNTLLSGVWRQGWRDRKDNSRRALFWAQGYFLTVSRFTDPKHGKKPDGHWTSFLLLMPRSLGVYTLFCLDSCLWSSQLSYLLAGWQHASGKTTPSRSSHHLKHSFLPLHLLQLLGTSNTHPGMHALNHLGEPKERQTLNTKQASK